MANSVTVDGVPYAGALPVVIPTIAPNQTVTVTFKVTANSLPAVNPIFNIARADFSFFPFAGYPATCFSNSNPATVFIIDREMSIVKSVDKAFAVKGDILTYTSNITNNGNVPVTNVVFQDDIPVGTTFINGSVTVNGVSQPTYDPIAGFVLPALNPGQAVTVTYSIVANDPMTQSPVTDYATLDYTVNDPIRGNVNFSENTNTVSVQIISNRITNVKSVDKAFAVKGDILHYTSVITNTGSLLKTDLVFTDPIPAGTTFLTGSVKVNGATFPAYNPQSGFALPDLAVGASVTVEFDVEVN